MATKISAPRTLNKAFALYTFSYILALSVAVAVGYLVRNLHPILIVFTGDICATLVIYAFGRVFRNASFYDAYWSITPLAISIFWMFGVSPNNAVSVRQIIVIVLVFIWGLRLTYSWSRQWRGLSHEDWRYQDLRRKYPKWFWLIDLFGIEIMPTVLVFLACLSLYPALATGERPLGPFDIIPLVVTAGAIVIETIADEQLRRFTLKKTQSGGTLAQVSQYYCQADIFSGRHREYRFFVCYIE